MAEVIRMPRISDTMEEGTIVAWLKEVGDAVEAGQDTAVAYRNVAEEYGTCIKHILFVGFGILLLRCSRYAFVRQLRQGRVRDSSRQFR